MAPFKRNILFCCVISIICTMVLAQNDTSSQKNSTTKQDKSAWSGTNAQLGLTLNSGNTNASNINAAGNLAYASRQWNNVFQVNSQVQRNAGVIAKEQYFGQDQANYNFQDSHQQFLFLNGNATIDKLSPYNYQFVAASGYGLDILSNDKLKWNVQAGPGFRSNKIKTTQTYESKYATTGQTALDWKITKDIDFTETFSLIIGNPSNYYKSVSALVSKIKGNFATNITFTISYYNIIPPDSSFTRKTDTTTAISLQYNIG